MKRFFLNSAVLTMLVWALVALASRIVTTPILGNYPNTSIPLSGDTTVMPDAAPTNTTRMNVSTSTNFKGKLEGYPATGVVRVTDAHPAGAYTVTVRAFDSGGGSATKTFMLTVTTPDICDPVSFAPAANHAAGQHPYSVAVGDFNGDGKQDLAAANRDSNNVSIFLGDGAGNFSAATNLDTGFDTLPVSVAVGDFNGDGKQDVVAANYNNMPLGSVSIFLGDGVGNFSAATNFPAGSSPYSVAVGDFNGDGKQDLAVANYFADKVSILLGDGTGNLSAPASFSAGTSPLSVAVGDFNGDGKQDLAVTDENFDTGSDNVSILLGNGAGNFSAPTIFSAGTNPQSVAVADFNGDGKQDLAVANYSSSNVSILLGDGAGNFSAPTNFAAGAGARSVAVGDFNGDGKQDLAVADNFNPFNKVSILLGNGAGSFTPPNSDTQFGVGVNPISVAVGDFNGDGKQDLATANFGSNNVSILLGNCQAPTLTSAVSRKTHGGVPFDIDLPLTGTTGVECRSGGATNDFTMMVTFDCDVIVTGSPQAQVTSGTGTIGTGGMSNGGMVSVSGNIVTIPLTNVADQQTIQVQLNGVDNASLKANHRPEVNVVIPMSRLLGDTTGNRAVNAGDVTQTKARLGQTVGATNFRSDVNVSGTLTASDAALVRANSGHAVP